MGKRHREDSTTTTTQLSEDDSSDMAGGGVSDNDHSSSTTASKIGKLDRPPHHRHQSVVACNFLPHCHSRPFPSFAEFESHYAQVHTNRCIDCKKNFPSERYLQIHIVENHDVFAELKKERGEKIYGCFVDGCERMCSTPQKRRLHVIDKHGFPKDFYFRVVDYGIDNCTSLLRKPRSYSQSSKNPTASIPSVSDAMPISEGEKLPAEDSIVPLSMSEAVGKQSPLKSNRTRVLGLSREANTEVDMMTDMMASIKLIPPSVRFGRRGGGKVRLNPK